MQNYTIIISVFVIFVRILKKILMQEDYLEVTRDIIDSGAQKP
jgi:hypothetical protein